MTDNPMELFLSGMAAGAAVGMALTLTAQWVDGLRRDARKWRNGAKR